MFAVLGVEVWSWLYEQHEIRSLVFWLIDFFTVTLLVSGTGG